MKDGTPAYKGKRNAVQTTSEIEMRGFTGHKKQPENDDDKEHTIAERSIPMFIVYAMDKAARAKEQPPCECGKTALTLARFETVGPSGHILPGAVLLCAQCEILMRADEPGAIYIPVKDLWRMVAEQRRKLFANKHKHDTCNLTGAQSGAIIE